MSTDAQATDLTSPPSDWAEGFLRTLVAKDVVAMDKEAIPAIAAAWKKALSNVANNEDAAVRASVLDDVLLNHPKVDDVFIDSEELQELLAAW